MYLNFTLVIFTFKLVPWIDFKAPMLVLYDKWCISRKCIIYMFPKRLVILGSVDNESNKTNLFSGGKIYVCKSTRNILAGVKSSWDINKSGPQPCISLPTLWHHPPRPTSRITSGINGALRAVIPWRVHLGLWIGVVFVSSHQMKRCDCSWWYET